MHKAHSERGSWREEEWGKEEEKKRVNECKSAKEGSMLWQVQIPLLLLEENSSAVLHRREKCAASSCV